MVKKLTLMLFLAAVTSCGSNEPEFSTGCSTGIRDGERKLIRCATLEEHSAGNNTAKGGVSFFGNYTQHQWEPVKDCQTCYDKYK